MMVVHKLGGKQKAVLISSSIRNTGIKKKKKINVSQTEKVKIGRERKLVFQ